MRNKEREKWDLWAEFDHVPKRAVMGWRSSSWLSMGSSWISKEMAWRSLSWFVCGFSNITSSDWSSRDREVWSTWSDSRLIMTESYLVSRLIWIEWFDWSRQTPGSITVSYSVRALLEFSWFFCFFFNLTLPLFCVQLGRFPVEHTGRHQNSSCILKRNIIEGDTQKRTFRTLKMTCQASSPQFCWNANKMSWHATLFLTQICCLTHAAK